MLKKVKKINNIIINFYHKYPITTYFIVANFFNGLLLRLLTTKAFSLRAIFFDFGFVLLLGIISLAIKKKNRNTYYIISSIIMTACCIINAIYYGYYNSFASISLLATSVFMKDVGETVIKLVLNITDWVYILSFIGLIIIINKYKKEKVVSISKNHLLKLLFIPIISFSIGCAIPPYNSFSRFIKLWNRVSVVNTFGIYIYQIDDLVQSLKPTFNNLFGHDKALAEVKSYYEENKKVESTNEYTKIFEGKNVIAIHAESLQTFTLGLSFNGKELTPNLNKLASTGIYFSNFYAEVGVGTSSDSEFTYATGLLPTSSGTVFVNYYNNKYITLQNMLNDKGYYVFSMHGNDGDFWNRDIMHLNMGYDKYYSKSSFVIDEVYDLGLSDKSFFKQSVTLIKDIKENIPGPYYGTLITLTNHTPWKDSEIYSDYDLSMSIEVDNQTIKRDYLNNTTIGSYLKAVNYMDEAIGQFIDDMDKSGLLEDTVIIIYGDHDARLGKNQFNYMYNYDPYTDTVLKEGDPNYQEFNDYDYELSKKVPFIIWTKDMNNPVNIDTPMGMIDVSSTIGNMLGVYNEYSLGKDIMDIDSDEGIVTFIDGSYITDKIYYNAKNEEVYTLTTSIISDDYIKKNSLYADKLISISYNIITYDLLRELK